MAKKKSKNAWFIYVRGSYLPNSWLGWLTYIPYSAYVIGILVYALSSSADLLHAIPVIVPNWIVALVVMTWIAQHKS